MVNRPFTYELAKIWAEDLCSRAEYTSGEIRERLIRKGLAASNVDRLISELIDRRFIDDTRFAQAFVRDKIVYSRWGKRKVAIALYQKRVAREIIDEALESVDEDDYITGLAELLKIKLRNLGIVLAEDGSPEIDYDTKARLYRFAASRGFDPSAISRAISLLLI